MAISDFKGTGVRYALDKKYKVEYRLEFEQGKIVSCKFYGPQDEIAKVMKEGVAQAIDDDVTFNYDPETDKPVDVFRPGFRLKFDRNEESQLQVKRSAPVEELEIDAVIPPQHAKGYAVQARAANHANKPASLDAVYNRMVEMIENGEMEHSSFEADVDNVDKFPTPVRPPSRRAGQERKGSRKYSDAALEKALMAYSTDLTERAKEGEIDPVVGRDRERVEIRELLLRKKRPSIMLLGEAGVGKTAIAEGLAQDIVDGKGEAELANARVIALDLNAMNAGTQFRGMFEERLKPILEGLEERGGYLKGQKVILFIDEIHSALTAGNAIGGTSAGQIMKPVLARGGVTCIGATTTEEFKKHIEDDKAMMRRFQRYNLQETKTDDTVKILNSVQQVYSHYHHMKEEVASDVCEYIVRMTDRFMPNQQQPDKSIGIIDDALSIARAKGKRRLSKEHVITAVAKATGLEREFIDQSDFDRYLNLEENLGKRVIGQAQAKKRVAKDLIAGRAGLTKEKAPRLVAVFPGPTGVGKTEVAKALAENLMGSEDNLVRIDMSKYKEQHSVSGLIGAPPGYVGHDQEGELTKAVREKPHSIILLDEIEKAHPEIYKVMLSIFDDGELKDNKGRMVDFTNTVIIMTTNLGSKEIQKKLGGDNMGFSAPSEDTNDKPAISNADIDKICRQAIEREFAPEVVNRIDGIYPFYALTRDEVVQILDLRIRDMQKNLSKSAMGLQLNNCTLEIDPKLKEKLAEDGYSPKFGARNLERPLRALQGDLGEWMMRRRDELKKMNREGPFTLKVSGLGEEFNAKAEKASKPAMDDAPAFLKKSAATPKP